MSIDKITILVSTVDRGIMKNESLLGIPLSEKLSMVVVNQMIRDNLPLRIQKPYCKIINSKSSGLSISRNLALDEVALGYAIIADDDVKYIQGFDKIIRDAFALYKNTSAITFRIETPDGGFFKYYSSKSFEHNIRSLLKVSSIDMVLKVVDFKSKVRFDESFGLGAQYNTGENNIFLLDAYRKGLSMRYHPESIVIHPFENSGRVLDNAHLLAKGAVFRRIFGLKGIIIICVFCLKKRNEMKENKLGFLEGVLAGINGFFKYRTNE